MKLHDPDVLRKLNIATKYPSIPTYHKLGEKGRLTEERNVEFVGEVIGTEKIDGVNARIILPPMEWGNVEWIIGSREEILHGSGDLVYNPAVQIVDTLKPWLTEQTNLDKLTDLEQDLCWACEDACHPPDGCCGGGQRYFIVLYLECFGGRQQTAAWKQYSKDGTPSFRLFDVALIPLDVVPRDNAVIAMWRDSGQQTWLDNAQLVQASQDLGIPLAPRIFLEPADTWPTSVAGVYAYMMEMSGGMTDLPIPEGAGGKSEGFVIRTPSSNKIAKIRFQDYERTLGVK